MMTEVSAPVSAPADPARDLVKVWDPLLRIFHWSLVALFAFSFFTGDEWKSAHILSGYTIAGLIVFRLIWGLIGPRHARFASFIYAPGTILAFLRDSFRFRAKRYLGHNPAGGIMVVMLLAMISVIATTGYMMTTDAFWGVDWVEETHEAAVYTTIGLIVLHIAGVILASVEHHENLARAMVTGWKRRN